MKKFVPLLLIALTILFNTTIVKLTAAENPPKQVIKEQKAIASNSIKYTKLHSIATKEGSAVNFYVNGNNIYITKCTPQAINIDKLEVLKSNSNSSKFLLNRTNSLPKGYIPKNLININSNKIKLEYSGLKLTSNTVNALYSMVNDAKKANVKGFIINSAYRSESTQREIFNANLKIFRKTSKTYAEAYEKTRKLVALPGNSEHQTGLAIDIFSVNGRHRSDFPGTKEQLWLNKNLYKYGFIIRYPADKTKETDSTYEPWHIRYVGIPLSSYLHEKNLCLDEFYTKIFAGTILENRTHVFMQIKANQKIFIDKNMLSLAELETVNTGTILLLIKVSGA